MSNIQYSFPVERILYAVQEELAKPQTVDLLKGFENGLKNEIVLIDRDGACTDIASVSPEGQVSLSVTYCQFLLLMCHVGLIVHDSIAVASQIERMTDVEIEQYQRELAIDCPLTRFLRDIPDYETAVRYCSHLIDIARPLLTPEPLTQDQYDAILNEVDYNSPLVVSANSLCVFGIVFILLHEASHVILGQDLKEKGSIQEEIDADHNAFWAMWGDLTGKVRNSAMMGCMCTLTSLLFYNPTIESDNDFPHPREDDRLFSFYDILKEEKKSYTEMLTIILAAWAAAFHVTDFPVLDKSYEHTLALQREFLSKLGSRDF